MLEAYRKAAAERAALGIPALPLNAQQTADLVELLKNPPTGEGEFLVELLAHRVPPGVDDAAKVKASFLAAVAEGSASSPLVSPEYATELLGYDAWRLQYSRLNRTLGRRQTRAYRR